MSSTHNPGRVAGFLYLLLVVMAPFRLIYIPSTLFVPGNATATANNIAAHELLFRLGIVSDLLKDASNSLIRVIGNGDNHWPLIYDRDLAELYVRIAESPDASGVFHANDEGDERVNDIVAAISEHAKTTPSVRHVPIAEARKKMGPYAEEYLVPVASKLLGRPVKWTETRSENLTSTSHGRSRWASPAVTPTPPSP